MSNGRFDRASHDLYRACSKLADFTLRRTRAPSGEQVSLMSLDRNPPSELHCCAR
jgi:hypothetical protein